MAPAITHVITAAGKVRHQNIGFYPVRWRWQPVDQRTFASVSPASAVINILAGGIMLHEINSNWLASACCSAFSARVAASFFAIFAQDLCQLARTALPSADPHAGSRSRQQLDSTPGVAAIAPTVAGSRLSASRGYRGRKMSPGALQELINDRGKIKQRATDGSACEFCLVCGTDTAAHPRLGWWRPVLCPQCLQYHVVYVLRRPSSVHSAHSGCTGKPV